jgi:hypothetical protein
MTAQQDTALIAGQLADLTKTVEELAKQLKGFASALTTRKRAQPARSVRGPLASPPGAARTSYRV